MTHWSVLQNTWSGPVRLERPHSKAFLQQNLNRQLSHINSNSKDSDFHASAAPEGKKRSRQFKNFLLPMSFLSLCFFWCVLERYLSLLTQRDLSGHFICFGGGGSWDTPHFVGFDKVNFQLLITPEPHLWGVLDWSPDQKSVSRTHISRAEEVQVAASASPPAEGLSTVLTQSLRKRRVCGEAAGEMYFTCMGACFINKLPLMVLWLCWVNTRGLCVNGWMGNITTGRSLVELLVMTDPDKPSIKAQTPSQPYRDFRRCLSW